MGVALEFLSIPAILYEGIRAYYGLNLVVSIVLAALFDNRMK